MAIGIPGAASANDQLLTAEQVAKLLHRSQRFVQQELGHLERRGYLRSEVDAWIWAQPSLEPRTGRRTRAQNERRAARG